MPGHCFTLTVGHCFFREVHKRPVCFYKVDVKILLTLTLGFQTPGEEVFGPQNHTDQTPNLRRYLED